MWQKNHRKSKKACVPRSAFEEEPEYYSFNDNYDYGDVDYEEDNEQFFTFFIHLDYQITIFNFFTSIQLNQLNNQAN